jgi:pimeloyl-ACP methyl ester carboxylesterase
VAWPPGSGPGDRLPVCLLLHPGAGDERTPFQRLRLHRHLAQAVAVGRARPFALASADGRGDGWRTAPGDDPLGMLLEELLPLLSGLGLRTGPAQVGVLGWSMGGAGALRLAEASPDRLAAVAATSPAVAADGPRSPPPAGWPAWPSGSTAAPTTPSPTPPGPSPAASPAPRSPWPRAATTAPSGSSGPSGSSASWPTP